MASSIKPSTIVYASIATAVTGFVAYAIYFDHRRRHDPQFRKALKRESRQQARAAKEQAEAAKTQNRLEIRALVDEAKEEGFPQDVEEKEAYFMQEVSRAETLSQDPSQELDSALSFYKALKVYPQPKDLLNIYDKTVPKPVLDILAEMVAYDRTINATLESTTEPSIIGSSNSSFAGVE